MKLDIWKKTNTNTIITQAAPGSYIASDFSIKQDENENESMPSEIGFPTLTGDVFLNQKPNRQTSHE